VEDRERGRDRDVLRKEKCILIKKKNALKSGRLKYFEIKFECYNAFCNGTEGAVCAKHLYGLLLASCLVLLASNNALSQMDRQRVNEYYALSRYFSRDESIYVE
jgi:hypothetical protein